MSLASLRRVMNATVRHVYLAGLGPRDRTSNAQRELHWLPIEQRVNYKLCVMAHIVVRGTAREYVLDMLTPMSALGGCDLQRSAALGL
jgi:hypothetical protein